MMTTRLLVTLLLLLTLLPLPASAAESKPAPRHDLVVLKDLLSHPETLDANVRWRARSTIDLDSARLTPAGPLAFKGTLGAGEYAVVGSANRMLRLLLSDYSFRYAVYVDDTSFEDALALTSFLTVGPCDTPSKVGVELVGGAALETLQEDRVCKTVQVRLQEGEDETRVRLEGWVAASLIAKVYIPDTFEACIDDSRGRPEKRVELLDAPDGQKVATLGPEITAYFKLLYDSGGWAQVEYGAEHWKVTGFLRSSALADKDISGPGCTLSLAGFGTGGWGTSASLISVRPGELLYAAPGGEVFAGAAKDTHVVHVSTNEQGWRYVYFPSEIWDEEVYAWLPPQQTSP